MLKELKSQHRNIIQMSFNGYSNNEIAERLGMAHTSVSTILRSPLGQAYLNGLQDRAHEATLDVRKKLVSLNKSALDTFEHLLNSSSRKNVPAAVQFNAAKDVLDRNGYKAPDRLNIDMTFQTKTDEELDAEIAAIEAVIGRPGNNGSVQSSSTPKLHSPPANNLPENNASSKQTPLTNQFTSPSQSCNPVSTATCSPDAVDKLSVAAITEEELSLEDFFDCTSALTDDDIASFEEVPLIEDPTLLASLPADIFNSSKRS